MDTNPPIRILASSGTRIISIDDMNSSNRYLDLIIQEKLSREIADISDAERPISLHKIIISNTKGGTWVSIIILDENDNLVCALQNAAYEKEIGLFLEE